MTRDVAPLLNHTTLAVVLDPSEDAAVSNGDGNLDERGLRVPLHVSDRLRHLPEDRGRQAWTQLIGKVEVQLAFDAGRGEHRDAFADGLRQTVRALQGWRPDLEDQPPTRAVCLPEAALRRT